MKITKNIVVEGKHQKPILLDTFFIENNEPKQVVIFCHGYKGFKDWGAWNLMAKKFAEARLFFIKFNFSHNGGTIEQPIDFPDLEAFGNNNYTKELDDLARVIDWVFSNDKIRKEVDLKIISLIGHSRGGGVVIIKASEDDRVKKVISLAAVCDFGNRTATIGNLKEWEKEGVKYVLNSRTKQKMPHYFQFYQNYINHKNRLDIKKSTEKITVPQLIIHGNQDTSIDIKEGKNLHKWNPKSQLKIIDGANHVFGTSHPWKSKILSEVLEKVTDMCIVFLRKSAL